MDVAGSGVNYTLEVGRELELKDERLQWQCNRLWCFFVPGSMHVIFCIIYHSVSISQYGRQIYLHLISGVNPLVRSTW